jgi:hypothetical protein
MFVVLWPRTRETKAIPNVAAETVHFSSRIEILVSKFGRTSKLSPRFLIVVSRLGYFVTYEALTYRELRPIKARILLFPP